MGGPIVRTGTTPAFWENWDRVFKGKKGVASASKKPAKAPAKAAKSAKPKTAKKKK